MPTMAPVVRVEELAPAGRERMSSAGSVPLISLVVKTVSVRPTTEPFSGRCSQPAPRATTTEGLLVTVVVTDRGEDWSDLQFAR